MPNIVIDYASVLTDLKAKREKLDAAIAGIETMLGDTSIVVGGTVSEEPPGRLGFDSFLGLGIAEAVEKFLQLQKKSQTTQEIADGLRNGGMHSNSDYWANTVGVALARVDASGGTIIKIKRGTWGLSAWYPGRRRAPSNSKGGGIGE